MGCVEMSYVCFCDLSAPLNNLNEFLLTSLLYSNIQTKTACRFFKQLDKPTCARGVEVLAKMTKKVNDLKDENDRCMARIKDLGNKMTAA